MTPSYTAQAMVFMICFPSKSHTPSPPIENWVLLMISISLCGGIHIACATTTLTQLKFPPSDSPVENGTTEPCGARQRVPLPS